MAQIATYKLGMVGGNEIYGLRSVVNVRSTKCCHMKELHKGGQAAHPMSTQAIGYWERKRLCQPPTAADRDYERYLRLNIARTGMLINERGGLRPGPRYT